MNGNINTKEDIEFLINQLKNLKLSNKQGDKIRYKYDITRIFKHRTIPQNKYLWLCNNIIAEHTGYTADEVHYSILAHLRIIRKTDKQGNERKIIQSTSKMDTKTISEYVENVKKFASAELDLYIPDAEKIPLSIYEKFGLY